MQEAELDTKYADKRIAVKHQLQSEHELYYKIFKDELADINQKFKHHKAK